MADIFADNFPNRKLLQFEFHSIVFLKVQLVTSKEWLK